MIKYIINFLVYLFLIFPIIVLGSTTEDGIAQFNQRNYQQAKTIFKSLAEQGNGRAMFWLGVTQFKTGKQFDAGNTLLKAAEEGNPWAMRLMVPSQNGYCDYLGWDCDETWMDKAISNWEKLAAQGDGNSIYALMLYKKKTWWSQIYFFSDEKKDSFKLIKKAVYSGGYKAASYNNHDLMNIRDQVELLKYEISKGYAPAMVDLYYISESNKYSVKNSLELLKQALGLGYGGGAYALYFSFKEKLPDLKTVLDVKNLSYKEKNYLKMHIIIHL